MAEEMKKAEFVKIEGTNYELIKYPATSYITKDLRDQGYYILVCANILADQPALIQELKELYGNDVDIIEKYIRIEVVRNSLGKIIKQRNKTYSCTAPVNKEGYTHSLSFRGKNKNYLEFIKWDIEKKLAERQKLSNLDIKVEEPAKAEVPLEENNLAAGILERAQAEDKTISESREDKGVDIPNFMKREEPSLEELFKNMDKIMDDFFRNFPRSF